MRILLVEDDQVLNRSLSAQLERAGYTIDRAEDGREGLYFATEYPLDLAIIDLGLPTLSGVSRSWFLAPSCALSAVSYIHCSRQFSDFYCCDYSMAFLPDSPLPPL